MNVHHLSVFYAVAGEKSVTRAAAKLHISQPAVSKTVRELEKSLGVALFHRLSTGVRLTDAGELLWGYAGRIFSIQDEAEEALRQLRALERGRLRIAASTFVGDYLLPEVCARFHSRFPGVEMSLQIDKTNDVLRRLLDGAADVALCDGPIPNGEVASEVFGEEALVVIVSPAKIKSQWTPEDLCAAPLLQRETGSGLRAHLEAAWDKSAFEGAIALGSTEAIKRAVAAGMGAAVVSARCVEAEVQAGILKIAPSSAALPPLPLQRLKLRGRYESRAARQFLHALSPSQNNSKSATTGR